MREVTYEKSQAVGPMGEVTEDCAYDNIQPKRVEDAAVFGEVGDEFANEAAPLIDFTVWFVDIGKYTA